MVRQRWSTQKRRLDEELNLCQRECRRAKEALEDQKKRTRLAMKDLKDSEADAGPIRSTIFDRAVRAIKNKAAEWTTDDEDDNELVHVQEINETEGEEVEGGELKDDAEIDAIEKRGERVHELGGIKRSWRQKGRHQTGGSSDEQIEPKQRANLRRSRPYKAGGGKVLQEGNGKKHKHDYVTGKPSHFQEFEWGMSASQSMSQGAPDSDAF